MSIFAKLFRKKDGSKKKSFLENDNIGTRHDTLDLANSYWVPRMTSNKKDPYIIYTFENENDARKALMELPCIHLAEDSQKLISTEVLNFGYYLTEEGKYEAVVCGEELNHELWINARNSFVSHNGTRKGDLEPEKKIGVPQKPQKPKKQKKVKKSKIQFLREDRKPVSGQTMIYRVHKGPDAISAKAFLQENPVNQQFHYIVVETPEGNYCRDIQGIYKE